MANYLTNFTITGDRLTNEQRDEQTNWRISPRIWSESAATLVRSFVASSVDYCNALLAGAPKATTNKLQRGLNAACGQRYPQVRSRLVATPRYRATLAGCSWASRVQARRHDVQVPALSSGSVPRGIVLTSRRCCITGTSPTRHPTAPGSTTPPTRLLSPTGFLCGWPVGLEFLGGQLVESGYWWGQFQTMSENFSVCNILMHLLEVSWRCAIISTFYLLT